MKTYTPDENGYINITITNDEPILAEISRCWGMLWTMLETKIV